MNLYKNQAGYYQAQIKAGNGRYIKRSTKCRNLPDARVFAERAGFKELETAAQIGVLTSEVASILMTGASTPKTVQDAIKPWSEHLGYRRLSPRTIYTHTLWVKAWMTHGKLQDRPLASISIGDLDGWVNADGDQKAGSRAVMLAALKSFCKFCQDSGWMQGNPANLIAIDLSKLSHAQKETLKRPAFSEEEVFKLIDGTAPGAEHEDRFWHAAIVIARYTGLRMGDICGLEWGCIDLEQNILSVWTQKRDRRVELPLEPQILKDVISSLPRNHPQYVFNYERGVHEDVAHKNYLSTGFARLTRKLGLPYLKTFHCLRATYISDCKAQGIPMEHIALSVGHSRTSTTEGYVRTTAALG